MRALYSNNLIQRNNKIEGDKKKKSQVYDKGREPNKGRELQKIRPKKDPCNKNAKMQKPFPWSECGAHCSSPKKNVNSETSTR